MAKIAHAQKCFCFHFHPFFNKSKSVENEKVQFPQIIKECQKKFHLSKEKIIFGHFCDFGKIKNSQKSVFSLERWKFFWHTLIIWGNCTFSFSTLFDLLKNG